MKWTLWSALNAAERCASTDYAAVDRIISHLKLTFFAERPQPPQIAYQEVLIAAEAPAEYSS